MAAPSSVWWLKPNAIILRRWFFPGEVVAGIRVAHIGSSSVRYEIAIFPDDPAAPCAARGHFVHVYVDRLERKPAALPPSLIRLLETLK